MKKSEREVGKESQEEGGRARERGRKRGTEKRHIMCVDKFDRSSITTTGGIPSTPLRRSLTRLRPISLSRGAIRERLLL